MAQFFPLHGAVYAKKLQLSNVGPAPEMALEFGDRLNLITGDNGLGKSFLLDIAWWSLTRRWPSEINPAMNTGKNPAPFNWRCDDYL